MATSTSSRCRPCFEMNLAERARDLIAKYGALCASRETALDALDRLAPLVNADTRVCACCDRTFRLDAARRAFFAGCHAPEPVRCLDCRPGRRPLIQRHPMVTAATLIARLPDALGPDVVTARDAVAYLVTLTANDVRTCRECGAAYFLTEPQRFYFDARGLPLPVRCKACRVARRAAKSGESHRAENCQRSRSRR